MPRLFTGIEIPNDIKQHLSLLKTGLYGARWISSENYHLTLRFAGDIDLYLANEFSIALENISSNCFSLRVSGLGSFGGKKPRSIWAKIETDEELFHLQRSHEQAARMIGLEPESRNYTPHITLARLKGTQPEDVAKFLENFSDYNSSWFKVNSFVLFSSRSQKGGGPYAIEASYPLENREFFMEGADK